MAEYKKVKYYYNSELAKLIAKKIKNHNKDFDEKEFIATISDSVEDLELKSRVNVFADALYNFLPRDYPKAVSILLKILGPENTQETGMFSEGYWLMPVAYYAEKYGINHLDISMELIYEITKRHTGEYAVRPFINQYTEKMLAIMEEWSKDENVHVRRLASEGVRPRLPWAKKMESFIINPNLITPILNNLKEDESRFVQKSVANCLNDILKDNHQIAINVIKEWSKSKNRNTQWIVKHALRNELKKKNPEAESIISDIE